MRHCYSHTSYHQDCYRCREANEDTPTIPMLPVDDGPDLLTTIAAAEIAEAVFSPDPTPDPTPDFGGGDSGGGGASGDFS